MYGCVFSAVDPDALVLKHQDVSIYVDPDALMLKHQDVSIYNADYIVVILDKFHTEMSWF